MKTSMAARSWRVCFVAAYCCLRIASPGLAEQPPAAGVAVSASSQWGPGFGADAAVDGIAGENLNYWQTVQGTDKGAWWQADLGEVVPVYGLSIAWARYQNKYHSPPATAVVQVSSTGAADSWKDALVIGSGGIPRDESSYEPDRIWKYPLPVPAQARYVRLLFPEGDQPGARYEGYLCIGEVEIQAPGIAPQMVTIEAAFGKAEVNASRPALVRLFLQSGEGPGRQSLLATHGRRSWARGGCTYVVGEDGTRYESRTAKPGRVNVTEESGRTVLKITGAGLAPSADGPPVAVEDWTLSSPGDGSKLVWKVVRRWQKDFTSVLDGSPGLFFSFDARHRPNSTTSTIWYDPLRIVAGTSDLYRLAGEAGRTSQQHLQVLRDRDTWAVYKLWTNWDSTADLRLEVEGGHLYRRGSFSWLSEAGAASGPSWRQSHRAGEVEKITLAIGGVEKRSTGYQLAVTLPDKPTETSLKRFYDSVLNGGAVNDQKGFDFGNETDGWYYAGSCWMYGAALSAGVPAPAPASFHPYDAAQAFREHLAHVLSTVDDEGRARFGYNQGGQWVDDNLHTIIGFRFYLLHTGDLPFIRQNLQSLERMLQYFIRRRGSQGLFELDDVGAHWYYDAITTSGVNGYHNAFFYKAAMDLAEMEEAAGKAEQAARYRELAGAVKDAYNRVLWKEDAPGGPRYLDWIDSKGREVSYFCDLCQWPPVAVGIASAQQARKIVATADARIAELEKEHGYAGDAGLSALWPVPPDLNPHPWQTFGRYMNGGSLLCQTYWEILARAKAGDAAGAAARLKRFARRAAETRWAGDNAADIRGEMRHGDGEPYLADMVCVAATALHGILGIQPTWQKLEVTPCLRADWPRAEADLLYKGRRHRVTIENGRVQIQPAEQRIALPLLWVMDFNLRRTGESAATCSGVDFTGFYGDTITLAAGERSGVYQSPVYDWGQQAELKEIAVAAELHGGRATAVVEISDDGFKTAQGRFEMPLAHGVNRFPLDFQGKRARAVRVGFSLTRADGATAPVVDAFRVVGSPEAAF